VSDAPFRFGNKAADRAGCGEDPAPFRIYRDQGHRRCRRAQPDSPAPKAAVLAVADAAARPGQDYVVIARKAALDLPFETLKKDLERAFHRVHHASKQSKQNTDTAKS
jgi:hypothetical protein